MNVIRPQGMNARDWMDFTGNLLGPFVTVIRVETEDQWREWGFHIRQVLTRRGIIIPIPDQYDDWRDWAERFNQMVQAL